MPFLMMLFLLLLFLLLIFLLHSIPKHSMISFTCWAWSTFKRPSPGSKGKLILSTAFTVVVANTGVNEWLKDGNGLAPRLRIPLSLVLPVDFDLCLVHLHYRREHLVDLRPFRCNICRDIAGRPKILRVVAGRGYPDWISSHRLLLL